MKPFVLLPGTLCDERLWHRQVEILRDFHIVDLRTQSSVEEMLEAVARAPFERFVLAGFSMGGYLAQEFALRFPERVQALAVLGASCEGYPPSEKEVVSRALPMLRKGLFKGLTENRLKQFLHPRAYANAAIRELVHAMVGPDANAVYLRQLTATLDRRDLTREIGKIRCPFVAISGKEDQIVPAESVLRIEQFNPRAEVYILPECGHFVPLEQPERVNAILAQLGS